MSKAFYTEYVSHCLRFYVRHLNPKFKSDVDKYNWVACDRALNAFSDSDREALIEVYREGDTVANSVYRLAKSRGIKQEIIWNLIKELERKVMLLYILFLLLVDRE